jgi:hypothetical protein
MFKINFDELKYHKLHKPTLTIKSYFGQILLPLALIESDILYP